MPKTSSNTDTPKEGVKTRNKSNSTERRNSVSEITGYFQSQMATTSSKNPKTNKTKDKTKEINEVKETKDSKDDKNTSENNREENAEKTSALEESKCDNHDNCNCNQRANKYLINEEQKQAQTAKMATQTAEDLTLKAVNELQKQVRKIDDCIYDPKTALINNSQKHQTKYKIYIQIFMGQYLA